MSHWRHQEGHTAKIDLMLQRGNVQCKKVFFGVGIHSLKVYAQKSCVLSTAQMGLILKAVRMPS